ncbi:hypothetical protein, partial [Paenibacillus sp. MAEPY1]|uniref:hypothetical protein n=1 Tax=Paenibacillus sp. MAEPY1 TaxID=1395586 RepID=UPI00052E1132
KASASLLQVYSAAYVASVLETISGFAPLSDSIPPLHGSLFFQRSAINMLGSGSRRFYKLGIKAIFLCQDPFFQIKKSR